MVENLLTPEEAATLLKVSPDTIRSWLRKGMLPGVKVGGGKLWRISEATVDEFIRSGPFKAKAKNI